MNHDDATEPIHAEYRAVIRLDSLPKEVGVLLITAGVGGLVLPGPIGTPLVIVGGVVLWPSVFRRVDSYFERKFPKTHTAGMKYALRFITDLERRYPTSN